MMGKKLIAQRNRKQANGKKKKARKIERWQVMNKKKIILSLALFLILIALISPELLGLQTTGLLAGIRDHSPSNFY